MASKIKLKNANGNTLEVANNDAVLEDLNVSYFNTVEELTTAVGSDGDLAIVADLDRGGNFKYDSTATDNGGTVFGKWVRQYKGKTRVEWFNDGVLADNVYIQAAIDNSNDFGIAGDGDFYLNGDITFLEKGRPDNKTYSIDFSGTVFSGIGKIIFDSCKNLNVKGLQAPNVEVCLRGVWYSKFIGLKTHKLSVSDEAGTIYSSNYWNEFDTCVGQEIVVGGRESSNKFTFINCSYRGVSGQGFDNNKDYFLTINGSKNIQSWNFVGGDVSYFQTAFFDNNSTGDIELLFDSAYFDSDIPNTDVFTLPNQYCSLLNIHLAGKFTKDVTVKDASKGNQQYRGKVFSSGFRGISPLNLMPNGDFSQTLDNHASSYGGVIGAFLGTISPVADSMYGNYINLSVSNGSSADTLCRFRTVTLPNDGVYSGLIIARNNVAGVRNLNFGFGGQFFDSNIGQDWTVISLASNTHISAGGTQDLLMRSTDGGGYDIDIKYVGFTLGTHPPFMCPQHPSCFRTESLTTNEIKLGKAYGLSKPKIVTGAGSPEGVVTASPGSLYLSTSVGLGTTLYVKESGTGNTGWIGK